MFGNRRKFVESAVGSFCQWRSINPTQGGPGQETLLLLVHSALNTLVYCTLVHYALLAWHSQY